MLEAVFFLYGTTLMMINYSRFGKNYIVLLCSILKPLEESEISLTYRPKKGIFK
jgi:hypothetical protein